MRESWEPDGNGWSGSYIIEFDGVPGCVAADFNLYPTDDGCDAKIDYLIEAPG